MANNLQLNPWYLDTASANYLRSGSTTPANKVLPTPNCGPIWIASITWSGNTTNTDTVTFEDPNGNTILKLQSRADLSPITVDFDKPLRVWDLAMTQISSGTIMVALA